MSKKKFVLIALNVTDRFGNVQEKYVYKKGKRSLNVVTEDMFRPETLKEFLSEGAMEEHKPGQRKTAQQATATEKATAQQAYFDLTGKAAPKSWSVNKINEEMSAWTQKKMTALLKQCEALELKPKEDASMEELQAMINEANSAKAASDE